MDRQRDRQKRLPDVDLLARFIWNQARGEKLEGKLAVAHVVLNRARARAYPRGAIRYVLDELGDFTGSIEGDPRHLKESGLSLNEREFALCKAIAELATRGHLKNDPTSGATHFHRISSKPVWSTRLMPQRQIGNLVFYRDLNIQSLDSRSVPVLQPAMGRML